MKEIGGYFSLEIPRNRTSYLHSEGIHLNSGRNALEYILSNITNISSLWIPYYTCDVVLEPIKKLNIPYRFYHINENLELADEITLQQDEYLLATNYFGIKDAYMKKLALVYGSHLIIDNAQAFYASPIKNIHTVYSPRKFVGIPDGGIAYTTNIFNTNNLEKDQSFDRCSHLLKRVDLGANSGYADFKENSHKLVNQPIKKMSDLTRTLIDSIDFDEIKTIRRRNFQMLHEALGKENNLHIPTMDSFACPMVYPYFTADSTLKKKLIDNKVFVATYWPNVLEWSMEGDIEYELCKYIIPFPIDQRYNEEDIIRIIQLIINEL
ncbi:MAG: hypothetical protein E7098_02460 [Mediterranea massiliensis]|nr:hypothetical protein [Mediterranea massiliensis]